MPFFLKKIRDVVHDGEFKRLASNSGWTLAAKLSKAVEILVRSVIIARAAGVDHYAAFCILMAFVATLQELFNSNAGAVVVKFGAESLRDGKPENFKSLMRFCMILNFFLYLGSILFVYLIAYFSYGTIDGVSFAVAAALVASTAGLAFLGNVFRSALLLVDRFRVYSMTEITTAVVNIAAVAGVVWLFPNNLFAVIVAVTCCNLFTETICGLVYFFKMPASLREFWAGRTMERDRRSHVSWFLVGNSSCQTFQKMAKKGDVLIVGIFATPLAVAIYDVAKKISGCMLLIIQPLALAAFPQISRLIANGQYESIFRMLRTLYSLITIPILLTLAGLFFFGEPLVRWIYGNGFEGAGIPLTVLAVSSSVALAFFWCNTFVLATGRLRSQFIAHFLGAVGTLACGLFLASHMGATGMAISVLLGSLITNLLLIKTVYMHVKTVAVEQEQDPLVSKNVTGREILRNNGVEDFA